MQSRLAKIGATAAKIGVPVGLFITLGLLSGQLVPRDALRRDCSDTQGLQWDATAQEWQCGVTGGDVTGVTAGAGMTGDCTSGNCTPNVVAASGGGLVVDADSMGLVRTCSAGERLEYDGTDWQCRVRNDYRSKHLEYVDEWTHAATLTNGQAAGAGLFSVFASGTGAQVTGSGGGGASRFGLNALATGTTTTGTSGLFTQLSTFSFSGLTLATFEWVGGWLTLSTSGDEYVSLLGFLDTTTVNVVDGCYVAYDRGNVMTGGPNAGNASNLSCWCASGSTRTKFLMDGTTVSDNSFTTVNAPVGVAAFTNPVANVPHVKIVVTPSVPKAEFYIDGVKSCEIRNNIPTTAATGVAILIVKSAGTTSLTMSNEYTRVAIDFVDARSP